MIIDNKFIEGLVPYQITELINNLTDSLKKVKDKISIRKTADRMHVNKKTVFLLR